MWSQTQAPLSRALHSEATRSAGLHNCLYDRARSIGFEITAISQTPESCQLSTIRSVLSLGGTARNSLATASCDIEADADTVGVPRRTHLRLALAVYGCETAVNRAWGSSGGIPFHLLDLGQNVYTL